jgi:hypothetical protein
MKLSNQIELINFARYQEKKNSIILIIISTIYN